MVSEDKSLCFCPEYEAWTFLGLGVTHGSVRDVSVLHPDPCYLFCVDP